MFEKKAPKESVKTLKDLLGESAVESNKEVIQTLTLIYGDGEEEEKLPKVDNDQEIIESLKKLLNDEDSYKTLMEFVRNVENGKYSHEDKQLLQRFRHLIDGGSGSNSSNWLQCLKDLLDKKCRSGAILLVIL